MGVVVAFVNNKGGVGKTTSAVTIASVLAERHGPVLLVDLDSQASASLTLGVARAALSPSISQALLDGLPLTRAIRASGIARLDLVTGSIDLASTDVALAAVAYRERFLGKLLGEVRGAYRHVLIDTAPGLSLLGLNALAAADAFVVPAIPQAHAVGGVVGLLESVQRLTRRLQLNLRFAGVLLSMLNGGAGVTPAAAVIIAEFRRQLRDQVFDTEIPYDPHVAEAPSHGRTVIGHALQSAAAEAYRRAAGELLERLRA